MPLPDDFVPPHLTSRSLNVCRTTLQRHYGYIARHDDQAAAVNIEDILIDNGPAIRDQGIMAWQSIWTARSEDTTPADAIRAWRQDMIAWAETHLIG